LAILIYLKLKFNINKFMHNLFKSKQIDQECRYINEKCLQECVCIKTKDNNITKDFFNSELFYWECNIYLALCEKGFIPLASTIYPTMMIYYKKDMISLRSKLIDRNCNVKEVLNELFNFVNLFYKNNFIHGNLHIDNIFIDKYGRFYIIDFTNSYLIKSSLNRPKYKRRSFINSINSIDNIDNIEKINAKSRYIDFFTLYISLKSFLTSIKYIRYLDNLINNYIKQDILYKMLDLYIKLD